MTPDELADLIETRAREVPRLIVGFAGPPGSGKTTLAEKVLLLLKTRGAAASMVPMDGFHLDNVELEARGLLARKGAPETFDADAFVNCVEKIARNDGDASVPGFDRSKETTVPDMHHVSAQDSIVLLEGNYLLLDVEPWDRLEGQFGLTIFLAPPTAVLERRLVQRWIDHGLEPGAARERAMGNDIPNALTVMGHSGESDIVIG